jgi:hypothetical protein
MRSFKRYRDSMKALKEASFDERNGKVHEIEQEVYKYLKQGGKYTPLHLAFAAKAFQKSGNRELATLVLKKCII